MARRTKNQLPYVKPKLTIPIGDAGDQLDSRIREGESLKLRDAVTDSDVDQIWEEYGIWHQVNGAVITSMFDVSGPADEYNNSGLVYAFVGADTPADRLASFRKTVDDYLNRLRKLRQSLLYMQG